MIYAVFKEMYLVEGEEVSSQYYSYAFDGPKAYQDIKILAREGSCNGYVTIPVGTYNSLNAMIEAYPEAVGVGDDCPCVS